MGAWSNLRAVLAGLVKVPFKLARASWRMSCSPVPLSIELAQAVDGFGAVIACRLDFDPETQPRLFTASMVDLTTWLRHPAAALDSYRRHLRALQEFDIAELRRINPIDTLREWSVKYRTANPDDWDLVRGVRL